MFGKVGSRRPEEFPRSFMRFLDASWGLFGGLSGASGGSFEASWEPLGGPSRLSGDLLGPLGGLLGASWGLPGVSWGGELEMSVRVPPLGPLLRAFLGLSWAVLEAS